MNRVRGSVANHPFSNAGTQRTVPESQVLKNSNHIENQGIARSKSRATESKKGRKKGSGKASGRAGKALGIGAAGALLYNIGRQSISNASSNYQ